MKEKWYIVSMLKLVLLYKHVCSITHRIILERPCITIVTGIKTLNVYLHTSSLANCL